METNKILYEGKAVTVEVERVFMGTRPLRELLPAAREQDNPGSRGKGGGAA